MAEWFLPAIISYQAIHNCLDNQKIENLTYDKSKNEIIEYLSKKCISLNSKNPVSDNYWKRKKIDFLKKSYAAVRMSEEEGNIFDVRTLFERTLKGIDLLTYSFPCQDLSQQGNKKGMAKNSGTRSGLLWEIEKALEHTKEKNLPLPKFLIMENVTALMHSKNLTELEKWKTKLKKLGYKNSIDILNAADFGSPQARRRVFMISAYGKKINLPKGNVKIKKPLKDVLNPNPTIEDFIDIPSKDWTEAKLTKSNIMKCKINNYTKFNSEAYVYNKNFTGPTLTASGANSRIKIIEEHKKIRKLNANESYRYMGFDDQDFQKISSLEILSNAQMIYTCGNSISVEVLRAIFKKIGDNYE